MNTNTSTPVIVGGIIVLVVVGGLIAYGMSNSPAVSNVETPTPQTTNTVPSETVVNPSVPTVTTSTLVVVSNSVAVVTGRVTPNGAQTTYWYEYGMTSALGTRVANQGVGGGYQSISAPAIVNGLSANTTYYYRLVAQNTFGTVVGKSYSFMTNSNPPLQGIGPTTRTDAASAITRTTSTLNGQITPNNAEASYWFEYGETTELGNTTAIQSGGNGTVTKSVSVTLSNLKPLTKYYFRLNAQNQFGTMTGGTMSFTTAGPIASGSPTVTTTNPGNVATSSATMRGHLNPNSYPTSYWFEYGTDRLLGSILGSSTHTELTGSATVTITVSANVKDLDPSVKYYYRLVASNSFGTVRGDVVTFTTKR